MKPVPDQPKAKRVNLSYWFWGTIIVFAAIVLALGVIAMLRQGDGAKGGHDVVNAGMPASEEEQAPQPSEASAEELLNALNAGERAALRAVLARVEPELNEAFKQAYAAIPNFADFHYSVVGEYTELGHAALGDPAAKLQEIIFADTDSRLMAVEANLDQHFVEKFSETVDASFASERSAIGPGTQQAIDDALQRVRVTVPATAVTLLGSKAAASIVAKKIAVKLSTKATAKAGAKWATASASSGAGALLCSWAGPGAAICAVGGAVTAWIVTDYGMVKLDEAWSREQFEADLRLMIDDQKKAYVDQITKAYEARVVALRKSNGERVQDFTLRELSGVASAQVCRTIQDLIEHYSPLRSDLRARTPAAVNDLRHASRSHVGSLALGPTAKEIIENLDRANSITLSLTGVEGNVPFDYLADRHLSGNLHLGEDFELPETPASKDRDARWILTGDVRVPLDRAVTYRIALEQHLRIKRNRFFGGQGRVVVLDEIGGVPGLTYHLRLPVPLARDEDATRLSDVSQRASAGRHLAVELTVRGELLADVQVPARCSDR